MKAASIVLTRRPGRRGRIDVNFSEPPDNAGYSRLIIAFVNAGAKDCDPCYIDDARAYFDGLPLGLARSFVRVLERMLRRKAKP